MSKFRTAEIFSDYMVIQRGKNIAVFGSGEDGVEIFGELGGFRASCVVRNGKWKMFFPPMGAAKYMSIELSDDDPEDTVRFENVAIGEVWLAAGQFDMALSLKLSENGETALDDLPVDADCLRFFRVPDAVKSDADYDERFQSAVWSTCADKKAAEEQSAAGFYFAKELSKYLGVTVGIINCCSDNAPISRFIDKNRTAEEVKAYMEDIGDVVDAKNLGIKHESMLLPIAPYTLSGVLLYQGESGENHPEAYYPLLTRLIHDWRSDFNNDELPFIIGQISMLNTGDPNGDSLCQIREAQMRVYKTLKNTGIVVLADLKERSPAPDKEAVGVRFARQALSLVHGGCDGAFSPMISFAVWRGQTVELNFTNAPGGFKADGEPEGFEICGDDGVFVPAFADISGERIFVSANSVECPRAVRYLWRNYAEPHISNGFGLPLAPFRISVV